MTLDDVLIRVAETVDFLRASTAAPPDECWIACDTLCRDRRALKELIAATAPGRGTHDQAVAASLFVQGYSYRVASIAIAAYALGLPVPSVAPSDTAIRISRNRPAQLAHLSTALSPPDPTKLTAALFDEHFALIVASVRAETRVGERLLWGNIATSCSKVFLAVESATRDRSVRRRADDFIVAAGDLLRGTGAFCTVRIDDREGWFWGRTSCCLWYLTSAAKKCGDCSLLTEAELLEERRRAIAGADS